MTRKRADEALVEDGQAADARDAVALILAGLVHSDTRRIDKPGELLREGESLRVKGRPAFVSRGGVKLAHALDVFGLDPKGAVVLDAGASTGGFSDCVLRRGARKVYAVDVGYGQLAWSVRNDPRVAVMERTNVRSLVPTDLNPPPDLVVADISFGSLRTILPVLSGLAGPGAVLVVLVKPQFELAAGRVRGGVVTDRAAHEEAVAGVEVAAGEAGLRVMARTDSPISGADGNREIFLHLDRL